MEISVTFCVIHRYSRSTLCPQFTHQAIKKVKSMPGLSLLSEKPTTRDCANKKIPRVVTYHPYLPPHTSRLPVLTTISSTPQIASNVQSLRSLWLFSDALLAWGTSLSELKPHPLMTVPFLPSNTECLGALRCVTCREHIFESDFFKSHSTGAHHKILGHITCTTSNIIYLISCRICGIQYIGETKNSLKKQFYGHRSTVKTHKLDTPVGQHFNLPNHSISDMILQGIEALAEKSSMWIKHVHTIPPMVSTYRKGMTNFPFFLSPQHRHFYICFTC